MNTSLVPLLELVKQFIPQTETIEERYPVDSRWVLTDGDGRVTAFDVLGHAVYEGEIEIMCVEYLRYDSVWGWVGSGYAEWLEVAIEGGQFVLYTYTDGQGIKAA